MAAAQPPVRCQGLHLDSCPMKSVVAPLLLALTALIQAMGLFPYHGDGITLVGQLLFPILFGLMAGFLARRGVPGKFGTMHLVILVASVILVVLSVVGVSMTLPQLYPTMALYYIAFALVAVECALRIAGTPKKQRIGASPDAGGAGA